MLPEPTSTSVTAGVSIPAALTIAQMTGIDAISAMWGLFGGLCALSLQASQGWSSFIKVVIAAITATMFSELLTSIVLSRYPSLPHDPLEQALSGALGACAQGLWPVLIQHLPRALGDLMKWARGLIGGGRNGT